MDGVLDFSLLGDLHLDDVYVEDQSLLKLHHIVPHRNIEHRDLLEEGCALAVDESFPELLGHLHALVNGGVKVYQLGLGERLGHLEEVREVRRS